MTELTRPYAVTFSVRLVTDATTEDKAVLYAEERLSDLLQTSALWRVEDVTPEDA